MFSLDTDSWGYEISIEITKPDGTKDSWPTYSFNSNTDTPHSEATRTPATTRWLSGLVGRRWCNHPCRRVRWSNRRLRRSRSERKHDRSVRRPHLSERCWNDVDVVQPSHPVRTNTINLGDNAIVIDDCDLNDVGSTITGDDLASTVGIVGDDTNTVITLNGTTVSGYATGVSRKTATC